jgi:hypothetical protein
VKFTVDPNALSKSNKENQPADVQAEAIKPQMQQVSAAKHSEQASAAACIKQTGNNNQAEQQQDSECLACGA